MFLEACSCCCCWLLKWPLLLAAVIAAGQTAPTRQLAMKRKSHSCTGWLWGLLSEAMGAV